MKILYVTTIGITMGFFREYVKSLLDRGYDVEIATNEKNNNMVQEYYREWGCEVHQIDCWRTPFNRGNLTAIMQIKKLVEERKYDIVHCHTPIAAMCTRIACRVARKNGTKVFYTAHGFHFHKSTSLKNWLLYYPIEWLCSFFTDILITINKEDYVLAQKHMHAKRVEYIPGVGINVKKFVNTTVNRIKKRREVGIPETVFLLLSVGELNKNKNHQIIIRALAELKNKNVHYAIAGKGELHDYLQKLAVKLGVAEQIHFLGYRNDVAELYKMADVFCFPSYREGLGLAAIEAMACGLPIITSNIHGINDYSEDGVTGYKCSPNDVNGFKSAIERLVKAEISCAEISKYNSNFAKKYDYSYVNSKMEQIYKLDN